MCTIVIELGQMCFEVIVNDTWKKEQPSMGESRQFRGGGGGGGVKAGRMNLLRSNYFSVCVGGGGGG